MTNWIDTPSPLHLDDMGSWVNVFLQISVAWEVLALVVCWFASKSLVHGLRKRFAGADFDASRSVLFGLHDIDGALFPVLVLCLAAKISSCLPGRRVHLTTDRVETTK